jgi:branched-chain amino acid aminotransferase
MGNYISHNGKVLPADQPVLKPGNASFQYGEGLFETMRVSKGRILFESYHFGRLFRGMELLRFTHSPENTACHIKEAILQLCQANEHLDSARVRLTVFPQESPDPENSRHPGFIIESWAVENSYVFNENGLAIAVCPDVRKSIDSLSACKSTNYLQYALAAAYARTNGWDDCLVLNADGNICDSSISNIFWISDRVICTPPLSDGCIAGIMRRHLLHGLEAAGFKMEERSLTIDLLQAADEVFLTNVIRGIRPVKTFGQTRYQINLSRKLFMAMVSSLLND